MSYNTNLKDLKHKTKYKPHYVGRNVKFFDVFLFESGETMNITHIDEDKNEITCRYIVDKVYHTIIVKPSEIIGNKETPFLITG